MNLDKIIEYNFNFDKRELILKEVNNNIKVKFALFCANLNLHKIKAKKKDLKIIKDNLAYLESIDNYDSLTEKQIKDIEIAANAIYAANAANAIYAAYAAYGTNATYAAANAAYAAAYAATNAAANAAANAAYAANAAANATDDPEATKLTIMNHLRKLIIDNLSIEDKSNELLIMSL